MTAAQRSLHTAYCAAKQRAASSARASWVAVDARLGPVLRQARLAAASAWGRHLQPLLSRSVPNWPEVEAAVRHSVGEAAARVHTAMEQARQKAGAAKAAADAALLQQLQRDPQLAALATPATASAAVWGAVACVTVPLAWAVMVTTLRWLVFRLRPGSVAVVPPTSAGAWGRFEAALGYQFEQDATRRAALDGDSRGGTGRFA